MAKQRKPVIDLQRIWKTYTTGGGEVHALNGVDVIIERGDFVAIVGASGSGKSTLMNIVGCLDIPTRGKYHLDGVDVRHLDDEQLAAVRNHKIGFVFQSFNLIPRTSALANVELPLAYGKVKRKDRKERALKALDAVNLGDRIDHLPSELSGGQQQRVAVARALVTSPALLLADEPTGNLDTASTHEIMLLFSQLNAEGRTIMLITHEDEVAACAKRVIHLRDGLVTSDERTSALDEPPPLMRNPDLAGVA
jgi:putative ABC transport system ATP-binding protein